MKWLWLEHLVADSIDAAALDGDDDDAVDDDVVDDAGYYRVARTLVVSVYCFRLKRVEDSFDCKGGCCVVV